MSFDKIILPDQLLATLYKQGLIVIDNEIDTPKKLNQPKSGDQTEDMILVNKTVAKTPEDGTKTLSWLGNNKKNISIIVRDEQAIHLQDELLEILSAILNACKLNLADVAIINTHEQQVTDSLLREQLSPSHVLLFGVETSQVDLPFSIPDYKTQPFNNCAYLQVASLEKMRGNTTEAKIEKSKLWVCLKNQFGV
jgi:hypothetical protein